MDQDELKKALIDWSSTFLRFSLDDFHRYTRSAGLTLAQINVLMHLRHYGPCEVSHFSEMMQISRAGASQMIERMVQQGIVQRTEIPGDRRVRLVGLTDHGKQIVQESMHASQSWMDMLVQILSPEERKDIAAALNALNDQANRLNLPSS